MNSKELIRNYEDDIRAYENNIADLEILIRKLKRKIENQEASHDEAVKEKNRIVTFIERNKRKSSNLSQKYPRTKFVVGVSKLMSNFEVENNNNLINSLNSDIKKIKKEILGNYDLLEDYERQIRMYQDKANYCYTEVANLRSETDAK